MHAHVWLIDMGQPAEEAIIQVSVIAILNSVTEIHADCYPLQLLVIPPFMTAVDALTRHARHFVSMQLENIKTMGGVGNELIRVLLKPVYIARANQHDSLNSPWMMSLVNCFQIPLAHVYIILLTHSGA